MAYVSVNPWTGKQQDSQPYHRKSDIEQALTNAKSVESYWRQLSFSERGSYFHRLAELLRKHQQTLADKMTADMGKLNDEALGEVLKAADACDYYAIKSENMLQAESVRTDDDSASIHYQPLGCILGIMPWNYPVWQVIRFMAPTLMAGNVCLLKPAENVLQCSRELDQLIQQAGFPNGVFQSLFMDNTSTASVIADPRCQGVSLTGSEAAGRSVAATAGKHLKKSVMELGGSDPFIVLEDADVEKAATTAALSRFMNAGQTCIAAKRFIVVEKVADDFVKAFKQASKAYRLGDPTHSDSSLAPMARQDLRDKLQHQVSLSLQLGATIVCGCHPKSNSHAAYPASILDHVTPNMPVFYEEVFGPVASIIRAKDQQDALTLANQSAYGLGASIWTQNTQAASTMAHHLEAGSVFINSLVKSDVRLPFGGIKQSGFGRELSELGIKEFTNAKTIVVNS